MVLVIQGFGNGLERSPVRLVVNTLTALVLHGLALDLEFFLRDRFEQQPHAIGFQPQGDFELVDR